MNERESLFRRLSAACGGHGAAAEEPLPGGAPMAPEGDRVALFAKTFTAAGGVLLRGPVEAALSDLGEMLRAEGVTALFFPEDDAAAREIAEALVPFGPFHLTTGAEVRGGSRLSLRVFARRRPRSPKRGRSSRPARAEKRSSRA